MSEQERERKRLLVSVKNKQKNSKWPSVKGKDHRFSLLLVRGFWRNEPSVLSVCLENFTEERVKQNRRQKKKKLILAPRSCSQDISDREGKGEGGREGEREGSRDRSTCLRG